MALLAHGALPHPLLAVELEVGLQVEALDVSALVAPGRHPHPPEGQGAPQAHLKKQKKYCFEDDACLVMDVHNHNSHKSYLLAGLLHPLGVGGSGGVGLTHWGQVVEVPLYLGDAVLQGQQPLAQETLQGHNIEHEMIAIQGRDML